MDTKSEITEKYQYLKSRKKLWVLKIKTGITYPHIISGRVEASDNALMYIREAYNDALKLELSELETTKNAIEDKIGDVKDKLTLYKAYN